MLLGSLMIEIFFFFFFLKCNKCVLGVFFMMNDETFWFDSQVV